MISGLVRSWQRLILATLAFVSVNAGPARAQEPPVAAAAASPPAQPARGPGGADYPHAEVKARSYGMGGEQYWLFEPAAPAPKSAPVVVFLHGWGAMDPASYGAWIRHLVLRGNVVIFPRYQAVFLSPMESFLPSTVAAVRAALLELSGAGHVSVKTGKLALVGHSMGAALAANLAAVAEEEKLPRAGAVMCVQPGDHLMGSPQFHAPRADLAKIPQGTLLLVVVGDDDRIVGEATARRIYTDATNIPPADRNFVMMASDAHGAPALQANHFAPAAVDAEIAPGASFKPGPLRERLARRRSPAAGGMTDALDFFGTWKLFDGLTDAVFFGKNRAYALGDTPQQRFMGKWSDGVPVKEMMIGERAEETRAGGQ